jgi:hypothetical protein
MNEARQDMEAFEATSHRFVNLPSGSTLAFYAKPRRRLGRGDNDELRLVVVDEVRDGENIEGLGYTAKNSLRVELDREQFEALRRSLEHDARDLRKQPVEFSFRLRRESLEELVVDGTAFRASMQRVDKVSDVAPRAGSAVPDGKVAGGRTT